jgi:hypothetical protein
MEQTATARPIYEIAREIRRDWKNVNFAAAPYLSAMQELDSIEENYHYDSARMVVLYFLGNAVTWKGEVARRVKAELKAMAKYK